MDKKIRYFVEEIWLDHFVDSYEKEIESIDSYLKQNPFDSSLLGFRFFQVEQIMLNGKIYTGPKENYSKWIRNNKQPIKGQEHIIDLWKSIDLNDYEADIEKTKQK